VTPVAGGSGWRHSGKRLAPGGAVIGPPSTRGGRASAEGGGLPTGDGCGRVGADGRPTVGHRGRVRPVAPHDLPDIVRLHEQAFGGDDRPSPEFLRRYLTEILLRNPWYDDDLPTLVYEDDDGRVAGCLGVMPRRMSLHGEPVRVAVTHTFMVAPRSRSALAALQLMQAHLSGPQDLSLATQASTLSRKLYERCGGTASLAYSLRWARPLRPSQYVLWLAGRHGLPGPLAHALRPVARTVDALAGRARATHFHQPAPRVSGAELDEDTLLSCLTTLPATWSLQPGYDARSLSWLLAILPQHGHRGTLRKVLVRNGRREIVGWYLYYLSPGRVGEVVQLVADRGWTHEVLDHLLYDAWRGGAVGVSGQPDPGMMQALLDRRCFLYSGNSWLLAHSKHPALLQAIHEGQAFLTRLEGEAWWIGP
jgi:predicted N-acetyltransferase YhbS